MPNTDISIPVRVTQGTPEYSNPLWGPKWQTGTNWKVLRDDIKGDRGLENPSYTEVGDRYVDVKRNFNKEYGSEVGKSALNVLEKIAAFGSPTGILSPTHFESKYFGKIEDGRDSTSYGYLVHEQKDPNGIILRKEIPTWQQLPAKN